MTESTLIKNTLSQNSVDKEKIRQRVITMQKMERSAPVIMRPKRLAAVLCVCICLMLGAGITAYAMEIRAYNVAILYLKDLGVGIDGYSRKEIKLIYNDIQSGEFVKDLTVTILGETAQKAGIDTTGKNAKELFNAISSTEQNMLIAKVTSEQVKKVTADMKYGDVIALLGETIDIGSGTYILQYEVDGKYLLNIMFISLKMPCGYSGDELLTQLVTK